MKEEDNVYISFEKGKHTVEYDGMYTAKAIINGKEYSKKAVIPAQAIELVGIEANYDQFGKDTKKFINYKFPIKHFV